MKNDPLDELFAKLHDFRQRTKLNYESHPDEGTLRLFLSGRLPKEWRFSDQLIQSLAEGKVSEWHHASVAVHVRTCNQCNALVRTLKQENLSMLRRIIASIRAWLQRKQQSEKPTLPRRPFTEPRRPFTDEEVMVFFSKQENLELLRTYGFSLFGKPIEPDRLTIQEKRLLYEMMVDHAIQRKIDT